MAEPNKKQKIEQRINVAFMKDQKQLGCSFDIPITCTKQQLQKILNQINQEEQPHQFLVDNIEITNDVESVLYSSNLSSEQIIPITIFPEELMKVAPVTRLQSSLSGHTESILEVQFSQNGQILGSAGGDTTVRIWDIDTCTPLYTSTVHKNHVLVICFNPNDTLLAAGGMDNTISIHCVNEVYKHQGTLKGHKAYVSTLAWVSERIIASGSKDNSSKVWDAITFTLIYSVFHTSIVSKILKINEFLVTASHDKTIKFWDVNTGSFKKEIKGHGHRINYIDNYQTKLVSCSDDQTLFLYPDALTEEQKSFRLTGHVQVVNKCKFSPNGRYVISCSFDKCIKL